MPGDGSSPYSMTAGHFHSEKVVESFLGEPPFAWPSSACGCATLCVAAANLDRRWIGVDISPKAVELFNIRLQKSMSDLLHNRLATARTDIGAPVPYRPEQACPVQPARGPLQRLPQRVPVRVLEVDHVIPQRAGGQDNIENLQLLCAHCNRVKGDRPQEYLVVRLRELRIAA